ncbi:MAG: 50S ribosomal protein L21e [Candidatus Aenigmarchaeota archaeon]|nr:50S ribosomal protein L21e [Candidatus Aenigmarchaeota archaeon]
MRRSRGFRSGTRRILYIGRSVRRTITKTLRTFNIGDKVLIKHDASVQKGMPHPRFYGRAGSIVEKRGLAYRVAIKDGNKDKSVIARPEHIRKL